MVIFSVYSACLREKWSSHLHVAVGLLGQSAKELMSVIRILDAFILGAGTEGVAMFNKSKDVCYSCFGMIGSDLR